MASIGVVARQTGIQIGTLRKWELRYGFPRPGRRDSGQRTYSEADIAILLQVARRITNGERVGYVMRNLDQDPADHDTNEASSAKVQSDAQRVNATAIAALLAADFAQLRQVLEAALNERTLLNFVEEIAAPLTELVGEQWAQGKLPIHAEHLYSATLESLLTRESSLATDPRQQAVVLLTSPAGELHTLGLAMVKAVLSEIGIASLHLPGTLPLTEIVAATRAYKVRIVGVSASCHYPPQLLRALVKKLRKALPEQVNLWFGGAGMRRIVDIPPGVDVITSMPQLMAICQTLNLSGEPLLPVAKESP